MAYYNTLTNLEVNSLLNAANTKVLSNVTLIGKDLIGAFRSFLHKDKLQISRPDTIFANLPQPS